jgi:hypothetical protein
VSATTHYLSTRTHVASAVPAGLTHGFAIAFLCGAVVAGAGVVVTLLGFPRSASAGRATPEIEVLVPEQA